MNERELLRAGLPAVTGASAAPSGGPERDSAPLLGDIHLGIGTGNERDVARFLHDQWPRADQEILGRSYDWHTESVTLVARHGREVMGVLRGHFVGGVATVEELLVHAGSRGRGVGTRLLALFEERAHEEGCHKVSLHTPRGSRAEWFYRSRGFTRESLIHAHHFGFDYVCLSKPL